VKTSTSRNKEFTAFSDLANKLLAVPHAEIKAKLEAEKTAKRKKKESKVKRNDH
jgi:hypothetical protein